MGVETETLRLTPHTFDVSSDGRWIVQRSDGVNIDIPKAYQPFLQVVEGGGSIAQLVTLLRSFDSANRFRSLVKFLCFLYDFDLLADRRAVELAESLRPDTVWKSSLAAQSVADVELAQFNGRPESKAFAAFASLFSIALASVSMAFLVRKSDGDWQNPAAWKGLIVFMMIFVLGRSLRTLFRVLAVAVGCGREQSLMVSVIFPAMALTASDLSKVRAGRSLLAIGISAIFFPSIAFTIVATAMPNLIAPAAVATWLLLFVDSSPFSRSEWTEWLRTLYNFLDRRHETSEFSSVKNLHQISAVLWLAAIGVCGVIVWWPFARSLAVDIENATKIEIAGVVVLSIAQLFVLASFIDDVIASTLIRVSGSTERMRKVWKRKRPRAAVDETIQGGAVPLRADLEKLPFLRQIEIGVRSQLLERSKIVSFSTGQSVCKQGDADRDLYIVLSGRLAVAKSSAVRGTTMRRKVVAHLDAGSVFGEAAFFFAQPRTADVVALQACRLLKIPYHEATMSTANLALSEELQTRVWFLQALVSNTMFKELPSEALDALILAGRKVNMKAGAKIIVEGQKGDACYFMVQGKASVVQNSKLINRLQNGDVFGEIALVKPDTLRTATVVADSDVLLVAIDVERFWELMAAHLPLAVEIEGLVEKRLTNPTVAKQS